MLLSPSAQSVRGPNPQPIPATGAIHPPASAARAPATIGRDALFTLALALLTIGVFSRALCCGFLNLDDDYYVSENMHVLQGLSADGVRWAFTTSTQANWHPLTWLSLQADASIWGDRPFGFHLTNILLHGVNAALVFQILRTFTGACWRSAATALLFAVHPLRVESVAWVAERKDVLSVVFGLAALWAYAGYLQSASRRLYLVVAVLFTLSLLSKPTLVTLPCLLVVLDWWPGNRVHDRRSLVRSVVGKLPLFGLALASAAVTYLVQSRGGAMEFPYISPAVRLGNAVIAYGTYLVQSFWPLRLAIFYPHPVFVDTPLDPVLVAGSLLLLAALSIGAFLLRKQAPYLLTGWLWYLGTLVPMIGLVQVGAQAYADRYTYFPQIGILIALCWGCADLAAGRSRLLAAATVAAALALVALTWNQLGFWRNSITVWEHALTVTAPNTLALYDLGLALHVQERPDDAAVCFQRALKLDPQHAKSRFRLGMIFQSQGRLDDAAREFERYCEIDPNSRPAHSHLGDIYLTKHADDDAARHYERAMELDPQWKANYYNLALIERRRNHPDRAEQYYRSLLTIDPNFVDAHNALGNLLVERGQLDRGIGELRQAISLDPHAGLAHNNLALALEQAGDFAGAVEHFEEAARISPKIPVIWFNLGRARTRQKRALETAACYARAFELDPASRPYLAALVQALNGLVSSGDKTSAARIIRQLRDRMASAGRHDLAKLLAGMQMRYEHGEIFAPGGAP